jgi:hypothetical protein
VKTAILARYFMAHINLFMIAQDNPLPFTVRLEASFGQRPNRIFDSDQKCASLRFVVRDHNGRALA